ncbi:MAG: DUF4492 domain-containing protein [Bacteroidetes bacterium GWF2_33_38]|nr:MAG: DUF4492 domain-containing protein [Bacteroidetes bacterium GWF2_33_38]OFY73121.1 MAG: DUF4492 domain-containing protein [Bacteroidetes bacterium RIFOXYA12_FULL_33_9]OFY88471.1 MAG: DUF4492 domain-containing protein [Bacteroidetes bacterium RIFOXYA2_FULL_33_7]HBX51492.1 DUF4492 domain-containing protein [Bacteroidales bacterium]
MSWLVKIWKFYYDGFRSISGLGKKLWIIILIKVFIMFAILKIFFFPNFLNTNFETKEEKSAYIINVLTKQNQK